MTFPDFQRWREQVKRERNGVIDCGVTNLYAALASLVAPATARPTGTVHRCHLAAQWCDRFGIPSQMSRRTFVSRGVRDGLNRIFRHFGQRGAQAWLPADNYPVFHELARHTGLRVHEFETLPKTAWPSTPPAGGPELLLTTNPLKPLGRFLTNTDLATLRRWLHAGRERRVILDTVYTFDTRFDRSTLELLATGQVILIHSLTKGWLEPKLFGVAVVPEPDASALAMEFRLDPPSQLSLARARDLMENHRDVPKRVAAKLQQARERFFATIPEQIVDDLAYAPTADGYFFPVSKRWSDLIAETNVLGIPATAFGSNRDDVTVLSTLAFVGSQSENPL